MFDKRSIGIAFEADGTVRAAELISNVRSVILSRVWSIDPEGTELMDPINGLDMDNIWVNLSAIYGEFEPPHRRSGPTSQYLL